MPIYRVAFSRSFRSFDLADPSLLCQPVFCFDSTSKGEEWASISLVLAGEFADKLEPDFWQVQGLPQAFVCSDQVADSVAILWAGCEQLPVSYDGHTLWLGHAIESGCLDALDVAHCEWPSGTPGVGLPSRYSFHERRLGLPTVFTVPETCQQELYVYEYDGNPYEEFKGRVECKGLTGFDFQEIWNEEGMS